MNVTKINKKFDNKLFVKEICEVISKYSEDGNKFTNAEILSCLTAIYTDTLKQFVSNESGKYIMQKIIDEVFD